MSLLTITKLTESVGAEVAGLEPTALADDDSVGAAVLDALEDNGVLVFRGLHLDPVAQVGFCRRLGGVDHSSDGHHPVPGIYPITLDKSKNASAAYLKATFDWHIDGCTPLDDECPRRPPCSRRCRWPNGAGKPSSPTATRRTTPCPMTRRSGSGRCAWCTRWKRRSAACTPTPRRNRCSAGDLGARTSTPGVDPPQRPQVLVLGASADYVVGMELDEGRALLDELLARATVPEKVYSHSWSVGDTVIWDNRGVLHRAAPYDPDSQREMLRTTVLGDEPIE